MRRAVFALVLCACRSKEVTVEYDGDFSSAQRAAIEGVAERTVPEVRKVLPDLPAQIVVRVSKSHHVIPETGETAETQQPNVVVWQVDPDRDIAAIARKELRGTLFHELHHVVRFATVADRQLSDYAVSEGLATAFERDYAGASPPWGQYPEDVAEWAKEIRAQPDDAPRAAWLYEKRADGRRWVGMRVGTYWADCAMKASHQTSAELVRTTADDVIAKCAR